MPRNTSFQLSDELDAFIRGQVESGSYDSASEVVREALERLAEEKRKEAWLLEALNEGLSSGAPVEATDAFEKLREAHPWLKGSRRP
jgi:antitoxin ParD1/3/4